MFDPAALLIKSIGLALPVEAANGPAGQQPGEGSVAAGNGGFASLLALKLESAEPAIAGSDVSQVPTAASGSLVTSIPQPIVPSDWAAKSLPATGNILPPPLPTALPTAQDSAKPLALAPSAPSKVQIAPVGTDSAALPEVEAAAARPEAPQSMPAASAPIRRAAVRVAVAVPSVLIEPGEAAEPAKDAAAPQAAMPPALPFLATKPRAAPARSSKPETTEANEPEQKDPAMAEAAALPADLVPADLVTLAPIAASVPDANPAPAEISPSPAAAGAGKAPVAAAPALPAEIAPPVAQTDVAPAPALAAQARVALRLSAEPASLEGEATPSAAPVRSHEETAFEAQLPASARTVAAPAALPIATHSPNHGHVSAQTPATVEVPAEFTQIVDRLVAARDAVAPAEVRVTIDHAQFGKVSVGFTPDASGMNVTLAAADPEFARAVEAAAPFVPPAASEAAHVSATATTRGGDLPSTLTGQQGQQPNRQQPTADPRGVSAQANTSPRTPDSEDRSARGRGIFA